MKKPIFIILLVTIAFFSCNRLESKRENLQNSISKFSKKHVDLNVVTYYPEAYTEVQTDSIIANTFKVSIKNYSKMDSKILMNSETIEEKTKINYHRVFESEITISLASKNLFQTTISAENFKNDKQPDFWNNATLQHAWVDQEASNNKEVNLGISFINPKSNAYKLFELVVNTEGKQIINLIEERG